ncbi:MAG: acyltransferase family protein [Eubacterium sp.]|nr:acyltransferase family protein [Eubacterium sp.]
MTQRISTDETDDKETDRRASAADKPERMDICSFYWIRIVSCFAIVLLHSLFASNVYFEETMTAGDLLWSRIAENLLMWAVPCFLMITGALLLDPDKDIPAGRIYGKYLKRIVLALLVFTLVFQILGYLMEGEPTIIRGWLEDLFFGRSWAHMWYLYLMTGIYLMMPFYRLIVKAADPKMLDVLIILLFVFISVTSVFRAFGMEPAFYLPTTVIYPLYVFAGYRIYHKPLPVWSAAALTVVCSAVIIVLTCMRYETKALTDIDAAGYADLDYLFDYYSPLVVLQSAGLFSLMCRITAKAGTFVRTADACTFGIYLIHMIGVHAIMKWAGFDPYSYGPFAFVLMALLLFAASFAVTWVIRRIPGEDIL